MKKHDYNFDGGNYLRTMSASWFVSYSWFILVDKTHLNWQMVSNTSRISIYKRTKSFHLYWLKLITQMNSSRLNTNKIDLKGIDVINMANKLLTLMKSFYVPTAPPE